MRGFSSTQSILGHNFIRYQINFQAYGVGAREEMKESELPLSEKKEVRKVKHVLGR
jgi:hypothetical protein